MRRSSVEAKALAAIEAHGMLLVYPIDNRPEPRSLWYELYPQREMHWAWDEGADPRVVALWQLRERLARSRAVVYCKWYKGRAVFLSRRLFAAMLAALKPDARACSEEARELLALLEEDSPQSTKSLRAAAGLRGRAGERVWTRALAELWERLLVVGTGEVDDGAFPSLELGATRWIFESEWEARRQRLTRAQQRLLDQQLPLGSLIGQHWRKVAGR